MAQSSTLTLRPVQLYTHEQTEASTTWTITHYKGGYPIVDAYTVYNGETLKIMPSAVTYVDPNTCTLTFSTARTGFATVI